MVEILCGVTSSLRQGMQETTAYTEVDHRRPKLGGAIYKTLYESLTRFRRLLENGPKYKNKDELPYLRKRSGCFGAFRSILSFEF